MASPHELKQLAKELRIQVLRMNYKAGSGHTGGSFSCAEIVTVLYENYLRVRPDEPDWPQRDRFVLSKGHAAPTLYATLARKGYCDLDELDSLRCCGSMLQGHPCMHRMPGVDMSTGSLGMGLSVGLGMALTARLKEEAWRVFVLCGDGELQEGQNWEAFMSMAKWPLDNLIVTIDYNQVQLDGTLAEIMPLGDLKAKLESFGLLVVECEGHDPASLIKAYDQVLSHDGPSAVIAQTVKGKGVSFMEGQSAWHGKPIEEHEFRSALAELEAA